MEQSDLLSSAPRLCPRHQGLGVGEFMVYGFVFKSVHAYAKILKGKKNKIKKKEILRAATGTENSASQISPCISISLARRRVTSSAAVSAGTTQHLIRPSC